MSLYHEKTDSEEELKHDSYMLSDIGMYIYMFPSLYCINLLIREVTMF